MKSFIAILAFVAVASADVQSVESDAVIVNQEADVFPDQYQFRYGTSNGISAQESGSVVNVGKENEGIAASGSYSYNAPDGQLIETIYKADENGFVAQGAHIPTAPPVPDLILRALAYIAANPPKPEPNQRS